jgi:hypothetical protein
MISVNKMEYEHLLNEHKSLKLILSRTLGYEYKEELTSSLTLEELTLENKVLHARIQQLDVKLDIEIQKNKCLETRIESLEQDNIQLKSENIQLKSENIQLREDIKDLKSEIQDIKLKELYNQFMIAIQDINRMYSLEQILKNSAFTNLRSNRINSCHYINENDSQELTNAKITVLYEKLQSMNDSIRKKLNQKYPNVIRDVLSQIKPLQGLSEDDLEDANDWWN